MNTSTTNATENRNVVAVFVVHFDVHKGNMIEWQYPQDLNLDGIEYQAICSGLHRIDSDIIYFSREKLYGISVFQNKSTDVDRGAYMKAVGMIVAPTESTGVCGQAWNHRSFLESEINKHMEVTETIEPDRYDNLIQYYNNHKYASLIPILETTPNATDYLIENSANYNLKTKNFYQQKVLHKDDFDLNSLDAFVNYFGPDINVLWKAALLRKRIILENTPPMETTCNYVYYIYLLGQVPERFQKLNLIPKFVVGVNDIPDLEGQNKSYIACTPDSIFQIKSNLYDLLVTIKSHQPCFKSTSKLLQRHNAADYIRYRILRPGSSITELNDFKSTLCGALTGIYYWLYDDRIAQPEAKSTWQTLFAGSNHCNDSLESSEHDLLLINEDEDATEINNSQIFEAVVRASADIQLQQGRHNNALKFFQYLTGYLLEKLHRILSTNEEEDLRFIPIYPKDMVQLGLDPQADASFIVELVDLYFKKRVYVYGLQSMCHVKDCCCCCRCCQQRISI